VTDVLQVHDLRCRQGGRWVLTGVSLRVGAGEVVGLLGANGSGKSTLLAAVAGLRPATGQVRIAGRSWASAEARRGLGHAGELGAVGRTVDQLLGLVAHTHGRGDPAQARQRLGLVNGPVDQLSAGQRRRLAVACAVVHQPALVLLDEPMNHLDADGMRRVLEVVASERDRGAGLLVATHRPEELPLNRVVELRAGRLVEEAPA